MKKMYGVVMAVFFVMPVVSFAQDISDEKKALIKQLMDTTGAAEMGEMVSNVFVQQITQAMAASDPNFSSEMQKIVTEEVNGVIHEEMIVKGSFYELLYPVYDKYLDKEDLEGMLAFYATPLGKKMTSVMPKLGQESMVAGQQWGRSLAPLIQQRIVTRFEKEGIEAK